MFFFFFFSSRRRHTRLQGDWSSDVCSSDLASHVPLESEESDRRARGAVHKTQRRAGRCTRLADRKSTRLNSSHLVISYAVFCLKKKKKDKNDVSIVINGDIRRVRMVRGHIC